MNVFFLILGAFLIIIAVVDILWTTLWVDGSSGPLSAHLTTILWKGLRRVGGKRSRTLSLAGPLILVSTLFMWVTLIWAGWTFLFAGGDGALIDTRDHEPITWAGRIYFVAYSMFTMGNGDFSPKDGFWQIATSLATGSGMLFVTLGVSYVLSVLGAVSQKRSFASGVTGLGNESEAFVRSGWNGESFHSMDPSLNTFASQLSTLVEQHKAYPILHYYHSEKSDDSSAVAVAIFDEALTLFRFGIPEEHRPNTVLVDSARASVRSYLETLNSAFIHPASNVPSSPDLNRLRSAGIPVVSDDTFANALQELSDRRRKLLGLVEADAWHWPPVQSS